MSGGRRCLVWAPPGLREPLEARLSSHAFEVAHAVDKTPVDVAVIYFDGDDASLEVLSRAVELKSARRLLAWSTRSARPLIEAAFSLGAHSWVFAEPPAAWDEVARAACRLVSEEAGNVVVPSARAFDEFLPLISRLSPRERDVLRFVAAGMDNLTIAAHLGISERTVKTHVSALYRKLAQENRAQLALLGAACSSP
ncbi:MAG: response regulator transcription factor [Myxococcaceae bacterium]|nr:response regulator transcription factor [Myxococcaceae bacterium]